MQTLTDPFRACKQQLDHHFLKQQNPITMTDNAIKVGSSWDSIAEGRMAVFRWALDYGLSFEVKKADKQKWLAVCRKAAICSFRIRISLSRKHHIAKLTVFVPHTCPADTHDGWRAANSVKVLASNPLTVAAVVDDRTIRSREIQTIERLRSGRNVSYMQAYRTREKVLGDVYGREADTSRLIPSLVEAMRDDDSHCEYDGEALNEDGDVESSDASGRVNVEPSLSKVRHTRKVILQILINLFVQKRKRQ